MTEPPNLAPVIVQPARGVGVTAIAGDVVDALKASPVLLLIVLLNMAFAGGAAYYLVHVESVRAQNIKILVDLLDKCTMHTVPIDALQYLQPKAEPK